MPWIFKRMVVGGVVVETPGKPPLALDIFCQNLECTYLTREEAPVLAPNQLLVVFRCVVLEECVGTAATAAFQPAPFAVAVDAATAARLAATRPARPQHVVNDAELAYLHRHFHESTPWVRAQPLQWLHVGVVYQ